MLRRNLSCFYPLHPDLINCRHLIDDGPFCYPQHLTTLARLVLSSMSTRMSNLTNCPLTGDTTINMSYWDFLDVQVHLFMSGWAWKWNENWSINVQFNFAIDLAHHQRSIPLLIIFIHFWTGRVPYPNGHKEISISQYKEQSLPIIPYKTCCRPDGWCEQHHLIPEDVQKILRRMTTSYLRLGGTKSPLLSQFLQSWWNQGRIW